MLAPRLGMLNHSSLFLLKDRLPRKMWPLSFDTLFCHMTVSSSSLSSSAGEERRDKCRLEREREERTKWSMKENERLNRTVIETSWSFCSEAKCNKRYLEGERKKEKRRKPCNIINEMDFFRCTRDLCVLAYFTDVNQISFLFLDRYWTIEKRGRGIFVNGRTTIL